MAEKEKPWGNVDAYKDFSKKDNDVYADAYQEDKPGLLSRIKNFVSGGGQSAQAEALKRKEEKLK